MYRIIYLLLLALLLIPASGASAALPPGWTSQDIGDEGLVGSADEVAGTFTVVGSGHDIWDGADDFHYAYLPLNGNGRITARVVSIVGGTNDWRKAGVMIREDLNISGASNHAFNCKTANGGGGSSFQWRSVADGDNNNADYASTVADPLWVRLNRDGDTMTAYSSTDGIDWTERGTNTNVMATDVYIGLAVTSHDNAQTTTATFDNVSIVTCWASDPVPASGSHPGPGYAPPNVYLLLDYTPGSCAISSKAYFSDVEQNVTDRLEAFSLGDIPPWPVVDAEAFVVGYDDPGIPEYARAPLVIGTTYYWCVDSWDGTQYHPGETWTFTPMPPQAWGPDPADGEELVPTDPTLSWNLGDLVTTGYSVRYMLYIGTDEAAIEAIAAGSTTAPEYVGAPIQPTSFDITGLDSETEYFWRVDTKRQQSLPPFPTLYEKGDVWSFTTGPAGIGGILREWWTGIGGTAVTDLTGNPAYPSDPTGSEIVGLFEGPTNAMDNYGSRLHGWLYIQNTGDYTFWIATDDNGELWLSTDMNPANATMISWVGNFAGGGWAPARGFDDPDVTPSGPIHLEGGNMYYISGLMKEGGGGDNIAVAWQGPDSGGVREVIPGGHLIPYSPVIAEAPNPADRSADAPLNVTLSWTAGLDQGTGSPYTTQHVYVGSDPDVVAAANTDSPEYMGTTTGPNEYGPLSLSFYEKVYWRIDGENADSGTVAYPGSVWTFKATHNPANIVDANLKLWLKFEDNALDSSGYGRDGTEMGGPTYVDGQDAKAIHLDGIDDYVDIEYSVGISGAEPRTIAGWAKATTTAITNWTNIFGFSSPATTGQHFDIEVVGGTDSTTAGYYGIHMNGDEYNILPPDIEWHHLAATFDGTTVRYYGDAVLMGFAVPTVTIITNDHVRVGNRMDNAAYFPGSVDDVRIYDVEKTLAQIEEIMRIDLSWAWSPIPMHGAVDVDRNTSLSWNAGVGATAHTVYFGVDDPGNMVQVAGPSTSTTYNPPGTLDLGKTYYWSVVESPGGATGRTWKFTVSNYLVVDNMESYTPWTTPNNNIFETWLDGFGDCAGSGNDTGAVLTENADPVLGGIQSMKYEFDNDGTVFSPCDSAQIGGRLKYSKAEVQTSDLPSGIGSDWTVGGVRALYVPFYGQAGNATTESLWVQLQDGSKGYGDKVFYGAYEGESLDDFNEASWHDWYIDLADFGVDLGNVVSITLGIGKVGTEGETAFGSGTLYFDEIRVYGPSCVPSRSTAAFAKVDYAPEGAADCKVDYKELEVMTRDWLQSDRTITPEAISPGPVAWYKFDNNLLDSSGNGYNGTAELTERYAGSRPGMGMAIDCNGAGDYVSTGKTAADLGIEGNNPKTVTAWVFVRAFNNGAIFDVGNRANEQDFCLRTMATDNNWRLQYWGSNPLLNDWDFVYPSLNEWVHFVVAHDGTDSKVYANGELIVDVPRTLNTGVTNPFQVGMYGWTEASMDALIDDVRLFDYGLSHGQVLTAAGIGTPMYIPVTSPANLTDPEGTNNLKVNFKDYSVLLDSWGDTEEWPAW